MDHQKVLRLSISCLIMMIIATARSRAVMLIPPNIAPVCSGDELELTCVVPGRALDWNVSIPGMLPEFSTFKHTLTSVERSSPNHTITINGSNSFVFSRISPQDSQPLISRLLISPATGAVNGTVVICADRETRNSSSTSVYIVNSKL